MPLRFALLNILLFQTLCFIHASDQSIPFPPERRVVFTCLSWDDEIETQYYRTLIKDPKAPVYFTMNKSVPLVISIGDTKIASSFRSEPQSYLGPAILEFFTIPPPPKSALKERTPEPVASVFLPPDKTRVLLLFFKQTPPTDHPNLRHHLEVLPDSLDDLPMGGYLLINSTGKKLIGNVDKLSFELEAHSKKHVPSPADTAQKLEWLFWNGSRKEKPLYSSQWNHRPDGRSIIFITESGEQRGALAIKAIQDIGEPAKPKEESPPLPK